MFKGIYPDCLRISFVAAVFKNIGEIYVAINYSAVSLLCVVSKKYNNSPQKPQ